MNLILFSVTTFAVLDYFYRFMRFVSTDLAKIAKFLCFYSKSGFRKNRNWKNIRSENNKGAEKSAPLLFARNYFVKTW